MTRNLKALGLALVAALALSAMATSAASAETTLPAKFTFGVGAGETARVDGEQVGTNEFKVGTLPPMTCVGVNFTGSAEEVGSESTKVRVTPTFSTCHITLLGATKTITVTPNNCHFIFHAQTTETKDGTKHFIVTTNIDCTGGAPIEIHVYNTSNHDDTNAAVLCTFDVPAQNNLPGITPTNIAGTPDDILAHVSISGITTTKTSGSAGTCGPENNTSVYTGTGTVRATNEAGGFVNGTISG